MSDADFKELSESMGWTLIPLDGKRPIEKRWQRFCKEKRPFDPEPFIGRNAGIPCGPANGIIALDIDDITAFDGICSEKGWIIPQTRIHETGSGKLHYIFNYPINGKHYGCRSIKGPEGKSVFDIRGVGGQIVAPGSIHPDTSRPYQCKNPNIPIADAPEWLLDLSKVQKGGIDTDTNWGDEPPPILESLSISNKIKTLIKEGVPKGERSEAIFRILRALTSIGLSDPQILSIFEHYPKGIGEKYFKKGAGRKKWLLPQIQKARPSSGVECERTPLVFPDIISGVAGEFVDLYGSCLEVPKEFLYMAFLTALGCILSKRLTIETEISPQPRLYVVLLGQSADDRKSTAITKVTEFFESIPEFKVCWGVGSAEGLQKKLRGTDPPPLLLCLDEFKALISKCKIDSSVLLPCINTLFEANKYENRTKTGTISLQDAHLSILAASTVETYERIWTPQFTAIGFNNRLFLVPGTGKRKFSIPKKIPEEEKNVLKEKVRELINRLGKRKELDFTPEAEALYHEWYMGFEKSVHTKRLDTYALRLMCLLAINDGKEKVDEDIIRKTIALCDWQLAVRRLHDSIDAEDKIAKIEERIRRNLKNRGPLKDRDLKRFTGANRTGLWCYEAAKKNLINAKEVLYDPKAKTYYLLSEGKCYD